MAKGARRVKSQFRGSIRPFHLSSVNWSGKSDLPLMTSLRNTQGSMKLSGRRLYCSYYINELIVRFLRQSAPYRELFDHYTDTLTLLAKKESEFHALRIFELRLLKFLGYELSLDVEADGVTPIEADNVYHYDYASGAVCAPDLSAYTVQGNTLLSIAQEVFTEPTVRKESQRLLRGAIEYHCDGKTNRSRDVFRQIIELN